MKRKIASIIFVSIIIFFAACVGQDDGQDNQRVAYITGVETKLLKIEDNIIALRERADNVLTENRAEFDAQIDSLASKLNSAEEKLAELKAAEPQEWKQVQSEFDMIMAELDSLSQATRDW